MADHNTARLHIWNLDFVSRSRRRTPIFGNCVCRSERTWKKFWHKIFRQREKTAIRHGRDLPDKNEVCDVWDFGKDGKHYWSKATPLDMVK